MKSITLDRRLHNSAAMPHHVQTSRWQTQQRSTVASLSKLACAVFLLCAATVLSYAQSPVPFVNQPLIPDTTTPGGGNFTLTVNGTGFVSNSTVNWNGSALATQYVSSSQLTATVPAADIATASTALITVVNPMPGGGTSNVALFTVTANVGGSIGFTLASSPPVGDYSISVAAGDFNGDGKPDLAVTNSSSNTTSILLGDGMGNFSLASSVPVSLPNSVAAGDLNAEGKLDLAVTSLASTVSILLGDGKGNFNLASSPATGGFPSSVCIADLNGDGKPDLAVSNFNDGTVSILLGDGAGNFTLASSPASGGYPNSIAVGDFNRDSKLDLALSNQLDNTVSILLGDGAGNFALVSSPHVGNYPSSVAVGDFNGDGKLDLAVTNLESNTVSILVGDGTGNFTLASSPETPFQPISVAVGEFNGDDKLDLAVANVGSISVLLGDGTGNFTLASAPPVGGTLASVAVADFNGDGKLDVAAPDRTVSAVSVLLQVQGPGAIPSPASLSFGTQLVGTRSGSQAVTLTSTGTGPLDISDIATNSVNFSQTNNCGSTLAAGTNCTITVTFRPHTRGSLAGILTIADNAPGSPQKVLLAGVGTVVTLLPSSLNFGDQLVGTTSSPQLVTLTNHAKDALPISAVRIIRNNPGIFAQTNTCGTSVPAGGSCTVSVTFTPKSKGASTATLSVADKGGASPQTVALSGNGI